MNDRLKEARRAAGFRTATAAIEQCHWRGSTYRAHESGQNNFKAHDAQAYAQAYGVSAGWLLTGEGGMTPATSDARDVAAARGGSGAGRAAIRLCGAAAAGVWREAAQGADGGSCGEQGALPADPRYPSDAQFDVLVEGSSFNRLARAGDRLRCVDIARYGAGVGDGDLVVIQRLRGDLVEISARRLRRRGDSSEFLAESDDPRWQAPVIVRDSSAAAETVRLLGKIVWIYRPV